MKYLFLSIIISSFLLGIWSSMDPKSNKIRQRLIEVMIVITIGCLIYLYQVNKS